MIPNQRIAVIVNPHANSGRARKKWPSIARRLEKRIGRFETCFTERQGHATEIARDLLGQGFNLIIAAGGDGTINEVVNGFLEGDEPVNAAAVLAILPIATGGDFQRSLGIGPTLDDVIDVIATGSPMPIDIGKVRCTTSNGEQQRYFVNLVSFGMGGAVAARAKNFLGCLGGRMAFLWATLLVLLRYRGKHVDLFLDENSEAIRTFVTNIAVGNGQFHGGGMHPCPGAVMNDGLLDVTVISYLPFLNLVRDIKILYSGNVLLHPKVRAFQARHLAAQGDPGTFVEVDGEPLGELPLKITILPARVRILVGADWIESRY
jgi:diacylglycerol kinase (ATP)